MATSKADFVARDHELEAAHEKASEKLAEHRWHWTLDESNPDRISALQYAQKVGRALSIIQAQANGYAAFTSTTSEVVPGGPATLNDYVQKAKLGAEKQEAVQAVAVATGKSFGAAAHPTMRPEVGAVLATAQDRAERKGTTVSEELPQVAEWREKSRRATRQEHDQRKASAFRLVEFEGHLGAAVRRLREALALAREIDFTEEEVQLMEGTLTTLRTIIGLVDVRITGESGTDWDAAFAEVMGEGV